MGFECPFLMQQSMRRKASVKGVTYLRAIGFSAQKKGKISSIPSGSLCKGLNYVLDCTDNKYFQMCVSGRNNFIYYKMTTCGMEVGEGHVGGCEQSKGEEMEKQILYFEDTHCFEKINVILSINAFGIEDFFEI